MNPVTTLESQIDERMNPEKSSLFVYVKTGETQQAQAQSGEGEQDIPSQERMDTGEEVFA